MGDGKMTRIVLADDHAMFREGVRTLLEMEEGFEVAGEAGTGREALELCREVRPDVLVLDLDMKDMDGLDVTNALAGEGLGVRVVILTMHASGEYAARLLQAGAAGFISKYSSGKALPGVIRTIAAGGSYVPDDMKDEVMMRLAGMRGGGGISDREMQVMAFIADGLTAREIAERLGISPRTVETHKVRLMEKLGLKTTADIFKAAARMGIVKKF